MDLFDISQSLPEDFEKQLLAHKFKWTHLLRSEETDYAHRTDLIAGLLQVQMPTLVLGAKSDILCPIWQQKELVDCLREAGNANVRFEEIDGMYGHDTFLLDLKSVGGPLKDHLEF